MLALVTEIKNVVNNESEAEGVKRNTSDNNNLEQYHVGLMILLADFIHLLYGSQESNNDAVLDGPNEGASSYNQAIK